MLLIRDKLLEKQRTHELCKLHKDALNKYRSSHSPHLPGDHVTSSDGLLSEKERDRSSSEVEKSPCSAVDELDARLFDRSTALTIHCLRLMLHSRTETRARLLATVTLSALPCY